MKIKTLTFTVPLLLLLCTGTGCIRRPSGVLSERKMVRVMADVELAHSYVQTQPVGGDRLRLEEALTEDALQRNGVSREEYDSTLRWYGRNMDEYYRLFDGVDRELARRRLSVAGENGSDHGDNDIWPYARHMVIWPGTGSGSLSFDIAEPALERGDALALHLRMRSMTSTRVMLGVEYTDHHCSYMSRMNTSDRYIDLSLQTDTAYDVRRIFGYVMADDLHSLPITADSIGLIRTPLDTTRYYQIRSQRTLHVPRKNVKPATSDEEVANNGLSHGSAMP